MSNTTYFHALRPKFSTFLHNCNSIQAQLHEVYLDENPLGESKYPQDESIKHEIFEKEKKKKKLTLAKEAGLNMSSMILNCQSSGVRVVRAYMYRINSCWNTLINFSAIFPNFYTKNKAVFRIRIGSGFNQVHGSLQKWEGKNDPQK